MGDMTREEFASAVNAGTSSVVRLYREVDRLVKALQTGLEEPPVSLAPVRGGAVGKSSRSKNKVRLVIRSEYGLLLGPSNADDEEDEDDLGDEDEEDGVSSGSRKNVPSEIVNDQPLLAVRVAVFDPDDLESFEPEIQYAVMSDWALGDASTDRVGQRFELVRYMVQRIPRALKKGAEEGKRLQTSAGVKRVIRVKRKAGGRKGGNERRLSCLLPFGVTTVPLFTLNSAEELDSLVESIKEMWDKAVHL